MGSAVLQSSGVRPGAQNTGAGAYHSRMIEKYMWYLDKCEQPRVLDIGPISGSNIQFFLNHGAKIYVCDVLGRIFARAKNLQIEQFLSFFDYPDKTFDAIHLWDVADHLDNQSLSLLVKKSSGLLKPNGLLAIIAGNNPAGQPHPQYLMIDDDIRVTLKKISAIEMPYYHRANRDIEIAMRPLTQYSSFICMNGIREFLFRC
jgi:SAM-dependent methyltransferase